MANLFSQILNMSMTGSVVILLVLLVRLLLKRAPKIFSYALWSVVLFRLLCPVALTAPVSVLNVMEPEMKETSDATSIVSYLPATVDTQADFIAVPEERPADAPEIQPEPERQLRMTPMHAAALVWAAGAAGLLLFSAIQYLLLHRKLVDAVLLTRNIYLADAIDTAFVAGLLAPRIYLPSSVPADKRYYILAHEQHHIRRLDHVTRLLAYVALCIHWFNPLVWAAFILAGKDMEMSCDEAVIRWLGPQIRADYSQILLQLAAHRKVISGMPLAFGEGDTKGRVLNMAKWKKPKVWVSLICLLLCATVLVACAVNPEKIGQIGDPATDGPTATFTTSQDKTITLEDIRMEGPVGAGLGDFNFNLPEGIALQSCEIEHTGNAWDYGYTFFVDDTIVGGIALRYQEEANSADTFYQEWQADIGVPEASDPTMGYMGGGSSYADYEITYFPDVQVNLDSNGQIIPDEQGTYVLEQEVTHYFFLNGTEVYDLWFYSNRFPAITRETILKSCYIDGVTDIAAMESALSEEADALEQCRLVLEQIQSSGAYKIETQRQNGDFALNESALATDWGCEDVRLSMVIISESGGSSSIGGLKIGEDYYECDSTREWRETSRWEFQDPWLASFRWDPSVVAYMDTLSDENGTNVMLRIDQPYSEGEDQLPHYFVNFRFDPEGRFQNAYVQVNLFMENEFTETESIVSLDPELVMEEIEKEYQTVNH